MYPHGSPETHTYPYAGSYIQLPVPYGSQSGFDASYGDQTFPWSGTLYQVPLSFRSDHAGLLPSGNPPAGAPGPSSEVVIAWSRSEFHASHESGSINCATAYVFSGTLSPPFRST